MDPTILLVEDDVNDVFFMKRAMKLAGMPNPVQVAADGRQAIHYLGGTGEYSDRARFPLPCLVLLDLKLPHVMGLDVLKWVREQPEFKTLIVLILTSSKLAPDICKAYLLGANSYLSKPSSPDELPGMVSMINQYWLGLNQSAPVLEFVEVPSNVTRIGSGRSAMSEERAVKDGVLRDKESAGPTQENK
jgi:CheY-like chemotaxis protein